MNKPPLLFRHPAINEWSVYLIVIIPALIWFNTVPSTGTNWTIYIAIVVVDMILSYIVLRISRTALRKWRYAQTPPRSPGAPWNPVGPR